MLSDPGALSDGCVDQARGTPWLKPLLGRLRLPVIGAPMFLVSTPALVIAQCKAGVLGAMPALNARTSAQLDEWLAEMTQALADHDARQPSQPCAPFAINLIVHKSNARLEADLRVCEKHRVSTIITSLGARPDVNTAIQGWGGVVWHDVTSNAFAHKAIEKGADGLIAVAAGAGGHAGQINPLALIGEIRAWYPGPLALSGAIASGASILSALAMGADLAYIGSAFIATDESGASPAYKQMVVDGQAQDIVYSDWFTGVHGNYLRDSIRQAGLDPDNLSRGDLRSMDFAQLALKPWKHIWGSGQGIGAVRQIGSTEALVLRWLAEQDAAWHQLSARYQRQYGNTAIDPQ